MPSVKLYKQTGEEAGVLELDASVFGAEYNEALIHQAVTAMRNNKRQGTKSTLTRTEVRGGGIKPWRQKSTGRARQGSIRAPQWTKGGVVFAPKPRDFSQKLNKGMKRGALVNALSAKVEDGNVKVVEEIKIAPKTKELVAVLKALKVDAKSLKEQAKSYKEANGVDLGLGTKVLLVVTDKDADIVRAAGNIPEVTTIPANLINTYDVVASGTFVATKDAIKVIEEAYRA